ncbi:amino acid permease [Alicyclobacillus acidoterrestris]|uniref:Amino acid permease n=1 Tax=Alicyclobacillus acidoterrestris (strain ATCC 49025 / DSM 3922 / CIP 106132 / NCIMB 13137 / GD3B) TaxID=1356854 RepID=T0BKF1_ALIAG|nr:amino acid permease [Alicyclobacillus acidoterrestris]EPZ41214.1 gamma-aminobutyrate permease [Alicyclobacillus acidoterrestris ATCC 49025]UNO50913.1 amino acid permease [Alicyclobacillus acidoterrestris]
MLAIGGAIGTGLFVASGSSISTAGPGGALLAYVIVGIMVYFVMTGLGEMATFLPVAGSFETYASRFVDESFGFALGWNYWFNWAVTLPAELSAGALVMKYWFPHSPSILWSGIFLLILLLLNIISVKGYGEGEYWFASIKVATILIFIVMGLLMIVGILGGHSVGFTHFNTGGSPFHGGATAIFSTVLVAGFAFQGTEVIGLAAGESENPAKTIPKAIHQVFWRILIFYILAIFVIGMLIPYTDPNLLKTGVNNIAISPFTLVFKRAGFAFAAAVMNAIILTAVLSAGNSAVYASSRMLFALSRQGKAPKFLGKVNRRGVPVYALFVTLALGLVSFSSSLFGNGIVYTWMVNASGLSGFIAWLGISICHYRFRQAYLAQGRDLSDLKYKAKWYPFGTILAFVLCLVVVVGQDYSGFTGGHIDWHSVVATYIGIPLFVILWLGYKFIKKTKVVPLQQCDLESLQ